MFGKKKPQEIQKRRPVGHSSLAQFGLLDIPDINDISEMNKEGSDEDDESLEAELAAIVSGSAPARQTRQPKTVSAIETIDKLAEECMKDVDSEEDDDENLSGDEELMSELRTLSSSKELSTQASDHTHSQAIRVPAVSKLDNSLISTLEQRLSSYKSAESNAKTSGDGSRARRYGRGVKTLADLLRAAKAGTVVNEEDIPPAIQVKPVQPVKTESSAVPPVQLSREAVSSFHTREINKPLENSDLPPPLPPKRRSAQFEQGSGVTSTAPESNIPPSTKTSVTKQVDTTNKMLCSRRDQYKMSALKAKKAGDMPSAMKFIKIAKQFDEVIDAMEKGDAVDLSNMPPPPPSFQEKNTTNPPYRAAPQLPAASQVQQSSDTIQDLVEAPDDPSLFNAPPPPVSIEEALEQRLEKYRSTMEVAKNEGQNSKVRRLGRICKQYEDAIKNHKGGKPTNYEELPVPPGFGPIPLEKQENDSSAQTVSSSHPAAPPKGQNTPQAVSKPLVTPIKNTPNPQQGGRSDLSHKKDKHLQRTQSSVLDKQMKFLLDRQRMFKQAALEAKKRGDIQQAKEYLKMSMGLDPMIEATRSGLPIDATSIPTPPQLQEDFVIVEAKDCSLTEEPSDIEEMYRKLERDLSRQIQMCLRNKDHFLKLGDVASASKFETQAQHTRKDLDVIQTMWKRLDPLPRFHYETRIFSIIQCNTDLADNDLQVEVIRGVNLPGKPDDLDSYVKIEVPFPSDNPQRAKSHTLRGTNNPEYKESFKFEINRKSRALARIFKRHSLKAEVWSKGGFLRSDAQIGTVSVKLVDLEKVCTLHESYDLMDGRKACGGKLELKISIRDPLLAKQIEEVKDRWLVIG